MKRRVLVGGGGGEAGLRSGDRGREVFGRGAGGWRGARMAEVVKKMGKELENGKNREIRDTERTV